MTAIIRSYLPDESNPAIIHLRKLGCDIHWLQPEIYKIFDESNSKELYPDAWFIPEGGFDELGIKGTKEIYTELSELKPDHVILPVGTMGTACGILSVVPSNVQVILVPAWKGCTNSYVEKALAEKNIKPVCRYTLWSDYHFGGFAKTDRSLFDFMNDFHQKHNIVLDPVYTGKMMYALIENIHAGYFMHEEKIIAIHTGGIHGLQGFKYLYPEIWGNYPATNSL